MTVGQVYQEAFRYKEDSLILLIDFLVLEKKVLSADDDVSKLEYFMQDRFKSKMNQHLRAYKKKRHEGVNSA